MQRFAFILLLLVFGCQEPEKSAVKKPADLIPEEQMVKVLADVQLLEGTLGLNIQQAQMNRGHGPIGVEMPKDSIIPVVTMEPNTKPPIGAYDIFKKYGVTKKQYLASMEYYCAQPEIMNELCDKVVTELTTRQLKK